MAEHPDTSLNGAVERGWLSRKMAGLLLGAAAMGAGAQDQTPPEPMKSPMAATTTADVHALPQKQTELVASPQTREFLGKLGPFMAERAGTDYLMVVSTKDFTGKPDPVEISPHAMDVGHPSYRKALRDYHVTQIAVSGVYGRQQLDPILSQALKASLAGLTPNQNAALFTIASEEGVKANNPSTRGDVSKASATMVGLPDGKTLGFIQFDEAQVNQPLSIHRHGLPAATYNTFGASTLGHELGHVRGFASGRFPVPTLDEHYEAMVQTDSVRDNRHSIMARVGETYADRYGLGFVREAHEHGLTDQSDISRSVLQGRLKATFGDFSPDRPLHKHDTAHQLMFGGLNRPDETLYDLEQDKVFGDFVSRLDRTIGKTQLDSNGNVTVGDPAANGRLLGMDGVMLATYHGNAKMIADSCRSDVFADKRQSLLSNFESNRTEAVRVDDDLRQKFGRCVRQSAPTLSLMQGLEAMRDDPTLSPGHDFYRRKLTEVLSPNPTPNPP